MAYRNIRLPLFSRFIYLTLRVFVWVAVRVFYRRRLLLGRANLRFDGPAIVIANHPSTLMDALNPALEVRQEMFFLANYGMFKHPLSNWLFRRLFCIPVKRREDVAEGEARDNEAAFEQSFRHLEQNGVLFIAPEGTSWLHRFVRPLKTGTARIALGAEARNGWRLGVQVVPAGVSYTAPPLFRSEVVVQFGAPVRAADWAEAWAKNPEQAVEDFTQHLKNQLETLSVHARDETGDQRLAQLETLAQNEWPLPQKATFERSQLLARTALDDAALGEQCQHYFDQLTLHRLTDAGLADAARPGAGGRSSQSLSLLLPGFPLFAAGYAFWFLPCFLPWFLFKKMKLYEGYAPAVKIPAGAITFSLALWAAWQLLGGWGILGAVALAYFAEYYLDGWRRFRERRQALAFARTQPAVFEALKQERETLVAKVGQFTA